MSRKRLVASTADNSARVSPSNRNRKEQDLYQAYLSGSSIRAAALKLGIPKSSAYVIIAKMNAANGNKLPPQPSPPAPTLAPTPAPHPKPETPAPKRAWRGFHADYPNLYPDGFDDCARNVLLAPVSDQPISILVAGDSHSHPGIKDLRNYSAIGRLAARRRYDWIVQIGDSTDMHSLCHHVKNDTWNARHKPTFQQDLDALTEAWQTIEDELPKAYKPKKHITLGNHENWAFLFEDKTPEMRGTLVGPLTTIYESFGWTWSFFGQFAMLGGVGFTHAPLGVMGKPYGGKNVENTLANESVHDVVFGHTHRFCDITRPKLGSRHGVRVVNVGSAMPPGYIGEHARYTPNWLSYGLVELTVAAGHITRVQHLPFDQLFPELGLGEVKLRRRAA